MKKKNSAQTFIVEVKCQQHSTWQGTVAWVEGKKKQPFRSALEFIRLLDSAIGADNEDVDEGEAIHDK